jgi:hypothetical protein
MKKNTKVSKITQNENNKCKKKCYQLSPKKTPDLQNEKGEGGGGVQAFMT